MQELTEVSEEQSQGGSGPGRSLLPRLASLAVLLLAWQAASSYAGSRLFPGPGSVAAGIVEAVSQGDMLHHLGATLARVAAAFVLAMAFGTALGYAMGRHARFDRVADPWLVLLLNLPALVVIVLAYVWFGLTEAAAIGAVALNKIPNTVVVVREGARALDPGLEEVARAYRFGPLKRLRHVVLPQLGPYLAAAARSGLSLVWKIVLVVELLGRSNGVGFEISTYFQLFDVRMILAYALAFVMVMLVVETCVVQPIERRAGRWRQRHA
jgi:NitT/TauT family transport system permease protein